MGERFLVVLKLVVLLLLVDLITGAQQQDSQCENEGDGIYLPCTFTSKQVGRSWIVPVIVIVKFRNLWLLYHKKHTLHYTIVISNATYTWSNQWCINNYIPYEIQTTGSARRLAIHSKSGTTKKENQLRCCAYCSNTHKFTIAFPRWRQTANNNSFHIFEICV